MLRYEGDRSAVVVGCSGNPDAFPLGSRHELKADTAATRVLRTGRTARIDDYGTVSGPMAEAVRAIGVRSVVGAPIIVEGRLWGAIDHGVDARRAPAAGHRSPSRPVHRADGDRDRQHRVARQSEPARGGAGRAAAGGDAGGARRTARRHLLHRRRGGRRLFDVEPGDSREVRCRPPGVRHRGPDAEHRRGPGWIAMELDDATRAPAQVCRTGRSARTDSVDWSAVSGPIAAAARRLGIVSTLLSPIVVEGDLWGTIASPATAAAAARYRSASREVHRPGGDRDRQCRRSRGGGAARRGAGGAAAGGDAGRRGSLARRRSSTPWPRRWRRCSAPTASR